MIELGNSPELEKKTRKLLDFEVEFELRSCSLGLEVLEHQQGLWWIDSGHASIGCPSSRRRSLPRSSYVSRRENGCGVELRTFLPLTTALEPFRL